MKTVLKSRAWCTFAVAAAVMAVLGCPPAALMSAKEGEGQASLSVDGDMDLGHCVNTKWELTKTGERSPLEPPGPYTVTWTVTATKVGTSDADLTVMGSLTIINGGSADAPIGNIVVNLQKRVGTDWISAAANVADATAGDAATAGSILASASAEDPVLNGGYNYITMVLDPPVGKFVEGRFWETAPSGTLEFTNAADDTPWLLTPLKVIAPGETVNLLFKAKFNNTLMSIPAGGRVRPEVIVTFGNAGPRGGSGASIPNVDISGNGTIDDYEDWIRSVSTRENLTVPDVIICNDCVRLWEPEVYDPDGPDGPIPPEPVPMVTDKIVWNRGDWDPDGIAPPDGMVICDTTVVTVIAYNVDAERGTEGVISNVVHLTSLDCPGCVCCERIHLTAISPVRIQGADPNPNGEFFTYTQGGWGAPPNGGNPGQILATNFGTVYPAGVEVGIPGPAGYSMKFTSAPVVETYLPAGGTPRKLGRDHINPITTASGVFGGQVLALQLNVDFCDAGITRGPGGDLGSLKLTGTGTSLDGKTIREILAIANSVLGCGPLPPGYTVASLNNLVTKLNEAFDKGVWSDWAKLYLTK